MTNTNKNEKENVRKILFCNEFKAIKAKIEKTKIKIIIFFKSLKSNCFANIFALIKSIIVNKNINDVKKKEKKNLLLILIYNKFFK